MSTDPHSVKVVMGPGPAESQTQLAASTEAVREPARPCLTPPIDIHEGPEGLILEADLPGVDENTVSIHLEHNVLTLVARTVSAAPEGARTLYEEYPAGDFHRSFILSDEVERSRITAELRHGVLRLTLPKAERTKTRRIEIKS